jgi:hypothetical protein
VNRLHPDPATAAPAARRTHREAEVDADLEERLLQLYNDQQAVARAERRRVARLEVDTGEPLLLVPEFEADVHDLRGLEEVGHVIFGRPVLRSVAGR